MRVGLDGLRCRAGSVLVSPGSQQRGGDIHPMRQRIQFVRAFVQRDGLIESPKSGTEAAIQVVRVRTVRVQFERAFEAVLGASPVELKGQARKRLSAVRFAEIRIE